jgi:hypothetical protein
MKLAYQFIEEELGDRPEEIYAELTGTTCSRRLPWTSLQRQAQDWRNCSRKGAATRTCPSVLPWMSTFCDALLNGTQNNIKQVRSDLVAIMDEFATRIFEEMDYTQEGRNAERFAKLYGHLPDIYVPRIYWEYTGRRVLTMEWINGTKLTNMERLKLKGLMQGI